MLIDFVNSGNSVVLAVYTGRTTYLGFLLLIEKHHLRDKKSSFKHRWWWSCSVFHTEPILLNKTSKNDNEYTPEMITCFTKTRQFWEVFYLWNNTVLFIPVGKPQKIGSWSENSKILLFPHICKCKRYWEQKWWHLSPTVQNALSFFKFICTFTVKISVWYSATFQQ